MERSGTRHSAQARSRRSIALSGRKWVGSNRTASSTVADSVSSVIVTPKWLSRCARTPCRISSVSSRPGSATWIGWNRRSSAGSFSTLCRYSVIVVAPMHRSSPRASAGFMMFPASIGAPSARPAPATVWNSSMNRITSGWDRTSSITRVRRSSNSPRYFVPATISAIDSSTSLRPGRNRRSRPRAIRSASASTAAVFPTPASPTRTGLFLVGIIRTLMSWRRVLRVRSESTNGRRRPSRAARVMSRPYRSRSGVSEETGSGTTGRSPASSRTGIGSCSSSLSESSFPRRRPVEIPEPASTAVTTGPGSSRTAAKMWRTATSPPSFTISPARRKYRLHSSLRWTTRSVWTVFPGRSRDRTPRRIDAEVIPRGASTRSIPSASSRRRSTGSDSMWV